MTKLLLVAMSLIAGMASAATIAGRVQLRDERPLTGVTVTLGELNRTTLTDETGAFFFDHVAPGTYHVHFQWGQLQTDETFTVKIGRAHV